MKLKSIFLTGIFTLFLVSGLLAQDKYEYGTLKANQTSIAFITADNQEGINVKPKDIEKEINKKLNELSDKGWEVYSTTTEQNSTLTTYFLRKKK